MLILARAIQGAGGAAIMPLSLTLLSTSVPEKMRPMAIGVWGGVSGLGIALGPLIAGAVVEGLSWQAIFWLNIPIGVLCLPPILAALPESYGRPQRLDLLGLAIAGVFLVVFGIVRGEEAGWSSGEVLASLIGGGALLIAFIAWEARAPEPMMPLRLFRNLSFAVANIVGVLFSLGIFGAVFIRIQFLQVAQGATALEAGVRTMPWTGLITPKIGLRPAIVAGLACMTASLLWIALVLEADVDYLRLVPPFALAGIGMGLVFAPIASAVLEGIAPEDQAVASGTNSTAREIGVALGIAALSAVFTTAGGELNPDGFLDGAVPAIAAGAIALAAATLAGLLLPGFKPVRISPLTGEPVVRHRAEQPRAKHLQR